MIEKEDEFLITCLWSSTSYHGAVGTIRWKSKMRARKNESTKYLDSLKLSLNKRLDEFE
jgi:catechol-2,3-dioxygenase